MFLFATFVIVAQRASAQGKVVLHGKATDSAGAGVSVRVLVRSAADGGVELARGASAADGSFQVALPALPARAEVEVSTSSGLVARAELDSTAICESIVRPILFRVHGAYALVPVKVRARYQKRPSVFYFFESEPSSRSEPVGVSTEWLDPLSVGDAGALLRSSPELLVGADRSASVLGAPGISNQVQIGGMRVPAGLVTGSVGGNITSSPWDVTIGGAAGATVNLYQGQSSPYRHGYAVLRSGVGGVPSWIGAAGNASGVNVPIQFSVAGTGPIGRFGYRANAFAQSDVTSLSRWDRALGAPERSVLDSLSSALGTPTVRANERNVQAGVIGRLDLIPSLGKRVLAVTSAVTHSAQTGGTQGALQTGSLAIKSVEDIGLVELESTSILRERVLLTSLLSASIVSSGVQRSAAAPTIIATDTIAGSTLITGGAPPQAASNVLAAEGRSTGTWYSRDNNTRYVAQLQARVERARLGGRDPHTTFISASISDLKKGQAISLVREGGSGSATASSFVLAPAISARHDLGKNGSLLIGVRADAWTTNGVATSGTIRYIDVSPRVSYYRRVGQRSANRGAFATLRIGAGRFTDWPSVQQWADAWSGIGIARESCTGADVPSIALGVEAPSCMSGASIQTAGRTIAEPNLRSTAADRADASFAIAQLVPGIRAEFGAAIARTSRIAARLSPLMDAPVADRLSGEGGRALLVSESTITSGGIVPVALISTGAPDATRLSSDAQSTAAQWRVKFATQDPFARVTWAATYVLTTGTERSLVIASPTTAPGFVSAPLAVGGRHAFAFSLGEWIGDATIRIAGIARSGARFTPLADRDLNGDGRVNDAAYIPASESEAWTSVVAPGVRSCVRAAAGRIAAANSCTGPWSISSLFYASIPGARLGLPLGSEVALQVSNPLGAFVGINGVTFGSVTAVDPTLVHITGFDAAAHSFRGEPLRGFGTPVGLSAGISDPVRIALSIRLPLGPSVAGQRADAALRSLRSDTSARVHQGAALEYLRDLPPVPMVVLQAGEGIQITAAQRRALQALGGRWQASAARLILNAYADGKRGEDGRTAHQRLMSARGDFLAEASAITAEIRQLLSADQVDLLPDGVQRLLNPRFWNYISLQDAGEI